MISFCGYMFSIYIYIYALTYNYCTMTYGHTCITLYIYIYTCASHGSGPGFPGASSFTWCWHWFWVIKRCAVSKQRTSQRHAMAMLYIYIRSNIRNVQFIIGYHSLSKYHTSKCFPCCFLKKTLYGFGHVFVHHMIDHGHSSITVLACGFLSMISYAFQYPQKSYINQHMFVMFELLTQQISKSIAFLSCFFTWLICLGFPGTVCPNSYGNKISRFPREAKHVNHQELGGTENVSWRRCYVRCWRIAMDVPLSPLMELLNKWTYNYTVP